jgi:hypothetical protein
MSRRSLLLAVLACLVLFAAAAPSLAAERDYWRHSRGHFENTSGNTWVEKNGAVTHRYVEMKRTEDYVELYDSGRDVTVRLFDDSCVVKIKRRAFHEVYTGSWE